MELVSYLSYGLLLQETPELHFHTYTRSQQQSPFIHLPIMHEHAYSIRKLVKLIFLI